MLFIEMFTLQCPVTCGSGKQRRRVICVSENPYGPDCDESDKPEDERACQARERCNGYWFSGPWKQVQHNLSQ